MAKLPKELCPSEHEEQAALLQWWELAAPKEIKPLLFAIPNGGLRSKATAARLRAEGVRAGVPDLFLAVTTPGYAGLWLELKRGAGGKVSAAQKEMLELLRGQGYEALVCRGADEARAAIMKYLEEGLINLADGGRKQ